MVGRRTAGDATPPRGALHGQHHADADTTPPHRDLDHHDDGQLEADLEEVMDRMEAFEQGQ
eukprot:6904435-Alexandrium_andersonii.AAC.1